MEGGDPNHIRKEYSAEMHMKLKRLKKGWSG
jgi:hypothetical protein